MLPFPLHNDADYQRALALLDELWDAVPGSPEADVLDVMATLIEVYEKRHRTLPPADPRVLLTFKLRELGWTQRELGRRLGWGSGRVSEVLSGRRALTLRMVQELSAVLGLPPGLLVHDTRTEELGFVHVRISQAHAARLLQSGLESPLETLLGKLLDCTFAPPSYTVAAAASAPVRAAPTHTAAQVFQFPRRAAA